MPASTFCGYCALIDLKKITLKVRNETYNLPSHKLSVVHASSIDSTTDCFSSLMSRDSVTDVTIIRNDSSLAMPCRASAKWQFSLRYTPNKHIIYPRVITACRICRLTNYMCTAQLIYIIILCKIIAHHRDGLYASNLFRFLCICTVFDCHLVCFYTIYLSQDLCYWRITLDQSCMGESGKKTFLTSKATVLGFLPFVQQEPPNMG